MKYTPNNTFTTKGFYTYIVFFFFSFVSLFGQEINLERGLKVNKKSDGLSYQDKYALFIGINDYQDSKIPNLKYAVNDARELSTLFVNKLGFSTKNVTILLDSQATRANILDNLQRFIDDETIPENSQLIVYVASHGSVSKSGNKGFLLNYDTREGSELSTAISMDDLGRIASECRSKHVLFLVDACYGGFANPRSASGVYIKNIFSQKSRQALTAGNSDEKVLESGTWQHSAFTKVLLDALEREDADVNKDGVVATNELHMYLENRVSFYAKDKGGKQTPQLGKLTPDDGSIFIELKEGALQKLDETSQMLGSDEIELKLYSKIIFTSNLKSARVYKDNFEIGYLSDGRFEYSIKPGMYKFEVKVDKYEPSSQEVIVKPDTTITLDFKLESKFSKVNFKIEPSDAAVLLNGNLIGTGSFELEIQKGRHELLIEKKGFKPEKTIINLVQEESAFNFSIQKILATVELYSNPIGASVFNDSELLGKTPLTINLGYGLHNLNFTKDNYLSKTFPLEIKESIVQRHDILLEIKPEYAAAKEIAKYRAKHISNFIILGGLTYGSYFGYKYFDNALSGTEPLDDPDLYRFGKYSTMAAGGIFALSSAINLVKLFTLNKDKLIRKKLQEKYQVSFKPQKNGTQLAFSLKF